MKVESLSLRSVYGEEVISKREHIRQHGSFREKVAFDVAGRPPYAFGLLAAADVAKYFGISRLTAVEFGVADGHIYLGDEISPDTCRLWDVGTGKKLDKDRFRQDLGGVEEAYREVLKRIESN